jgi:uncharacterized protein (TIGR02145 family)
MKIIKLLCVSFVLSSAVSLSLLGCDGDNGAGSDGGGSYQSVTIGGKKWMKRNLNIETADSWCYWSSTDKCDEYGRLYTWAAAKKACPSGWHLPTRDEWGALETAAGGSTASKALKSKSGWNDYLGKYGTGTDNYGFSALPGGQRRSTGSFSGVREEGYWWSASEYSGDNAYGVKMSYSYDFLYTNDYDKSNGHSVRCVKN